jgi:peptidoglycan/xylan/chitin deacetylase (PgdA/CDA1 family)
VNEHANSIYLTFDDGPHATITDFVLDELKKYDAKATFFCIGKNVQEHRILYQRILNEGHSVGNHTQNHINGWKSENENYFHDIATASEHIQSKMFRPPYGRITPSQAKGLEKRFPNMKIIMWDVLSGDFDMALSKENCLENVLHSTKPGSIIVFHDSEKAWERLSFALPIFLKHCSQKGWQMKKLNY